MSKQTLAQQRLDAFEADIRAKLGAPVGEHWQLYLPENRHGDRLFAEWQRLAVAARRASETHRGAV